MIDEFKLAELINSKFCHDLAGPIGAVSNGVDFLNEDSEVMREKAKNLIEVSAEQSVARLQFFRQVYGSILETGEANLVSLREITLNYFASSKIELNWDLNNLKLDVPKISHRLAKIILNLILVVSTSLIKGGTLKVELIPENSSLLILIKASAEEIKIDEEYEKILKGDIKIDNLSSKNIQVYYTNRLLNALKAKLLIEKSLQEYNIRLEVDQE